MHVIPDWLNARADTSPERIALVVGEREWTFRELDLAATRMAEQLHALGVKSGDRVATLLPNGFAASVLPHATLRLGAILAPLNTRLTKSEIDWQLENVKPAVVIDDEGMFDVTQPADLQLRLAHPENSVLAIIHTSGTTGKPKGAMLTVGNFWWSAIGSALNLGVVPADRWLACLPLFHVGGLSIITRAAIYGICAEVHDGFDAARVNAAIDKGRISIVSVVAVMLQRMLELRDTPCPPTLRCILLGGGPASKALLEKAASMRVPVVQTYGLTETCSQLATLSPEDALRKTGSAGKPLYPNEIRISEDDEIVVRGPVVMSGYYENREATSKVVVDGWLHTGDAGRIDEEGFLYVLDRRDDLIITGGENVYPAEVESVLASYEGIDEVAVIGVPDDRWGQRVVAVVRSSRDLAASELTAFCESRLGRYKIPREFRFADTPLPRTAAGKLKRLALRNGYEPMAQ
ncbi:MAG TPA: o-succinylbenzoate--CoA ligase [Gemmatimonadaceae bacterium]